MVVVCPECGSPMRLRETLKFRHRDGSPRKFYGCSRYPECKATHGAHPDGSPLGVPGDAETKAARSRAHAAFDDVWRSGAMNRGQAYAFMRDLMGMTTDEAHIGKFTREQCETLIERLAAAKASRL